jgi:8-oxo-dGTP pyrophosphatase MutT (NUDIX family)
MTTTAVFAEIIVVGLQAEIWLATLVLAVFGADWVDLGAVDEWATLLTVLVLAAAYALGIIVDRLADTLVPIRKRAPNGDRFRRMRLEVLHKSGGDGVAKFLDYQRSRMRVARGTILNTAFSIPAVVAFLWAETDAAPGWIVGTVVVGVLVLGIALNANERISQAHDKNLEAAYELLTMGTAVKVAAAVPYRTTGEGLQVLLVRTKGGDKWTFPKGHVKPGEDPARAALREAEEEAGITGEIDPAPIAEYAYPNTRGGPGDDRVAAYLLRVTEERLPGEGFREPRWFAPEEALDRLAEGSREPRYVDEHASVLKSAVEQLTSPR